MTRIRTVWYSGVVSASLTWSGYDAALVALSGVVSPGNSDVPGSCECPARTMLVRQIMTAGNSNVAATFGKMMNLLKPLTFPVFNTRPLFLNRIIKSRFAVLRLLLARSPSLEC